MDNLPITIGAVIVLLLGFVIYMKITKVILKLMVLVVALIVLAIMFRDKLPF